MVLPRAFDLLDALVGEKKSLTLTEASLLLEVPRSSLATVLKTMTDLGVLSRSGKAYSLGPRAFALSSRIQTARSLVQIARPFLERAQAETGETLILAELDQDRRFVYYTDTVISEKTVRFHVPIASQRPLYASATGRVFLAYFSKSERATYLETAALKKLSNQTVTDKQELNRILDQVREQGWAINIGQLSEDAAGFAAPVFDETGRVRAAIAVGVPSSRAERDAKSFVVAARTAAREVSGILGYRGDQS
ncbi:IclR family transcriptional regulator [Rhodovibrionaceae bacterium A322]